MAKMVSLKLSKKESRKESGVAMSKPEGPEYPYGSRLDLDTEVLKKLGLSIAAYPPGTECVIEARGFVTRTSDDRSEGGKDRQSMCIQMTDVAITPDKAAKKKKAESDHLAAIASPTSEPYDAD